MVKPKHNKPPSTRPAQDRDLVPNEASEAFKLIEQAAREGQRTPTRGMDGDAVRALLLGIRKET